KSLGVEEEVGRRIRDGVLNTIPGIGRIMKELQRLSNHNQPMRTWGGREYFAEEPRFDKEQGRIRSFEYKLFNYRIQGSAADVTKQGMIEVHQQVPEARIAVQVHDELVVMARNENLGPRIAHAMCDMKLRVPMLATTKYSVRSWARAA